MTKESGHPFLSPGFPEGSHQIVSLANLSIVLLNPRQHILRQVCGDGGLVILERRVLSPLALGDDRSFLVAGNGFVDPSPTASSDGAAG